MPEDDEWEFVPHKAISDLKDEVQALKERLSKPQSPSGDLLDSMNELKASIRELHALFKNATDQIKQEEEEISIGKTLQSLQDRIANIERQNEQIAKAMLVVADMIEDFKRHKSEEQLAPKPMPRAPQRPMPRPQMQRQAPMPMRTPSPQPFPSLEELPEPSLEDIPPPPFPGMRSAQQAPQMMPQPTGRIPPPPFANFPPPEKKGLFNKIFKK